MPLIVSEEGKGLAIEELGGGDAVQTLLLLCLKQGFDRAIPVQQSCHDGNQSEKAGLLRVREPFRCRS